jgi:hypothetical protein
MNLENRKFTMSTQNIHKKRDLKNKRPTHMGSLKIVEIIMQNVLNMGEEC